jgi:PAS domain S-box-containing protein
MGSIAHHLGDKVASVFEKAFFSAPSMIIIVDQNEQILFVNEQALSYFGYRREELIGNKIGCLIPERFRDGHSSHFQSFFVEPKPMLLGSREILFALRKDGSEFQVEIGLSPLESGKNYLVMAQLIDVSGHALAIKKVADSELRYRRLFEAAQDGILILNAETGLIIDVNPYMIALLNNSPEFFIGKELWELGFFKDIVANKDAFEKLKQDGYIRYENLPLETHTGHHIWVEFVSNVYKVAEELIIQCNIRDISERRNLEVRLLEEHEILGQAYDETLTGWARALELRNKETRGHSDRVVEMTVKLARRLGITEEELVHYRRGALLHDIGKMGIPDSILLKADKLTDDERDIMRLHPEMAYMLLKPISFLEDALVIPHYHHEKWDGTGYPTGKSGAAIPLAARIFSVVDVYDAMVSDRVYREGMSHEYVLEWIESSSGIWFDPRVVKAFLLMFKESE